MSLSVRKLASRIGAIVEGVDLNGQADPGLIADLREALSQHKALFFDRVDLDDAGQQRVAGWFGELTTAHPTVPGVADQPHVLPVDSEHGKSNHWHTDVTFVVNPPQVTTLRSIVVPPYGGETLIANEAAAYRDLPDPLRELADSLRAIHTNKYDYVKPVARTELEREYDEVFVSTIYETEHPVVFDRQGTDRIGYASAMTMLEASEGDQRSYLEIAQLIEERSPAVTDELRQLWRRVCFTILISTLSWGSLITSRMDTQEAADVLAQVASAVGHWRTTATSHGLPQAEIEK